jgi:hypothetical protein
MVRKGNRKRNGLSINIGIPGFEELSTALRVLVTDNLFQNSVPSTDLLLQVLDFDCKLRNLNSLPHSLIHSLAF